MNLVLEIEYLSGISFSAVSPASQTSEWPPEPDRVFSALVASWAARGKNEDEAESLRWLERLPAPRVQAATAEPRTSVVVYVPPNDPRSGTKKHAREVLPALRGRQPRRFPATRPLDPVVRFIWSEALPDSGVQSSLQNLAHDTAYVGHSSSLTRCRFIQADKSALTSEAVTPQRWVYPGRLDELIRNFGSGRRPQIGSSVKPDAAVQETSAMGAFGDSWLLFEHVGGDMPDIRATALVAKTLRNAILSGYQRTGHGRDVPEVLSGHSDDGHPTTKPHVAVVPLAFSGFPYADGHIMGFALIPPRRNSILEDDDFRRVLRSLAPMDENRGRRILTLAPRSGDPDAPGFRVDLSPSYAPPVGKQSLDPSLYLRPARVFGTATPIVLDRHLKRQGDARAQEAAAQIARACRNIGLPDPSSIAVNNFSTLEGAPSAYPSRSEPSWMRWRLPQSLKSRQLVHAEIVFPEQVAGPVLLGAGRFVGLGICRPLRS